MVFPPDAFITAALVKEGSCTDLCQAGPARSPSCDDCTDLICTEDTFCCNNEWDQACIDRAVDICEVSCTP
jgi:hypothetical protein